MPHPYVAAVCITTRSLACKASTAFEIFREQLQHVLSRRCEIFRSRAPGSVQLSARRLAARLRSCADDKQSWKKHVRIIICNRATRTLEEGAEVEADAPKPDIHDNVTDKLVPCSWPLLITCGPVCMVVWLVHTHTHKAV